MTGREAGAVPSSHQNRIVLLTDLHTKPSWPLPTLLDILVSHSAAFGWRAFSIHHLEALNLPFHLRYSSLIYSKGLQSDRPKCRGMPADPRRTSLCKAVSKTILIWGETGSDPAFLAVIWLFLGIGQATIIPHLKEDIQGYLLI